MNDLDFVKAVRAIERYAKVPILMVTTVNHKQEVYEAVNRHQRLPREAFTRGPATRSARSKYNK
jgi:hypothetical protein